MDDGFQEAVDTASKVAKAVMAPVGGAGACLDAYEATIRAATDAQLNLARVVAVEPARAIVASCANLTRDLGATHLSSVRWFLDL